MSKPTFLLLLHYYLLFLALCTWKGQPTNAFIPGIQPIKPAVSSSTTPPHLLAVALYATASNRTQDRQQPPEAEERNARRKYKSWDQHIAELEEYKKEFGTVNVPETHLKNKDEWAGVATWVHDLRRRRGRLSQEKLDQLTSMGVILKGSREERDDQHWAEMFDQLKLYNITHGHHMVSQTDPLDRPLALWVVNQRKWKKLGILKPERIEKLNSINFEWQSKSGRRTISPKEKKIWFENLANLTKFHEENGHYWPSATSSDATTRKLGIWATNQRSKKKQGDLDKEREKELEQIGFPWDIKERREAQWFAKFEKVKAIVEQRKRDGLEGNIILPSVLGYILYDWSNSQITQYLKGDLDPKRKLLLDSIGFQWTPEENN